MTIDSLRLNYAGIINHGRKQAPRRLRGQQYLSAIGLNHAAVLYQCVHRALVHCDIKQAIPSHIKGESSAGGKRHRAEFCRNGSVVANVGT